MAARLRSTRGNSRARVLIVDLFCGIGGFSYGAAKAGQQVVLAIDNWLEALTVHKLNHPTAKHLLMELGSASIRKTATIIRSYLPKRQGRWHLHASPPCQRLSKANKRGASTPSGTGKERNVRKGMELVFWFLRLVRELKPTSWSMEQVPAAAKHLGLKEPRQHIYNAADFGIAQVRKRLIIGEGWTLTTNAKIKRKSVINVLPHLKREGITHLREYSTNRAVFKNGRYVGYRPLKGMEGMRPLSEPSFTLCAGIGPLALWRHSKRTGSQSVRRLTSKECLLLQGFPSRYRFPKSMGSRTRIKMIGNAVPPTFSQRMMKSIVSSR